MNYEIQPNTGYWFGANKFKAGDTILFKAGQHAYFSGTDCAGTVDQPITATFEQGVQFSKGIDFTNCKYWVLDGGTNQNLYINGATGVAMGFKGTCSNITIKGVRVENAYSFLWFKTEVNEQAFANWDYWTKNADGTITANYVMDGLTVDNFSFIKCNFDGCYIGSTGQKADRPVTIDGVQYLPLPVTVSNIKLSNGVLDQSSRTGLQISGLAGTGSYLRNVTISNSGTGREAYQGASLRVGYNSPDGIEISGCTFDGSFLYNVQTQCGGKLIFKNNTVRNSCYAAQGLTNVEKMAAVEFDTFDKYPCTIDVEGNNVDGSNNNVSLVVYGSTKSLKKESVVTGNSFQGAFQNQTGQTISTDGGVTPPEPPPTNKTVDYFKQVNNDRFTLKFFYTDGTSETVSNVKQSMYQAGTQPSGKHTVTFKDGSKKVMGQVVAVTDVREQTIEHFKDGVDKFIDYLMS